MTGLESLDARREVIKKSTTKASQPDWGVGFLGGLDNVPTLTIFFMAPIIIIKHIVLD